MGETRIGEAALERAIGGENEQPFAIVIEAAGGINVRDVDVVFQRGVRCAGFRSELAQHAIGLVEENDPRHVS